MFTTDDLLVRALRLVPLILSLTVHEFAHAWTAYKLKDDTAKQLGRLTLNPLSHIDLLGTVLLPLFTSLGIGWAKPVPFNPARFTRKVTVNTGTILVALAGPLSNLILAVVCGVVFGLVAKLAPNTLESGVGPLLLTGISMNVGLAIFNILPIPPLDGGQIVGGLMPSSLRAEWEKFASFAPFLLLGLFAFGTSFLSGPSHYLSSLIHKMIFAIIS